MAQDYQIAALWIGGDLSFLEQLCLKSFLDAGHHVKLYSYQPIGNAPAGCEMADANEVLPQDNFLRHARTNSPALHSDLFRYHLLAGNDRTIWADTDAYCVKPFTTETGHFYGWESRKHVNGGVLGFPRDSEALGRLIEFTTDEFAIPPWFSAAERAELEEKKAAGTPVHAGEMPWGVWGPHAITHFIHATGEDRYALPQVALYPIHYRDRRVMLRPGFDTSPYITDETFSIHFYGRRMRARINEVHDGVPRPRSLIGRLLKKHGIDPLAAPIPVKGGEKDDDTED
ncbi:glycosyltransferase family 32 protein [Acidimangrovimonas sediminis]|uniref:hypothetical protein n=1 Tax=Acidimangrovimonas sediminis TaxID=2056283 RepID=UPI000C807A79|nr:hypothetical protein [Acidimangrovimonas sediminis]